MTAAIALSERSRGRTAPNPNVGCILVRDGRVVGRGWTQPGGRPHAEAMALAQAGEQARGATAYVTLEPCAHESARGPACAPSLAQAGVTRVVAGVVDPDPRTAGRGLALLREAGVAVTEGIGADDARRAMAGFLTRRALGRPFVTLKLATSLDGCIALADGTSRWITGPEARAHTHLERARHEAILVGRGTWDVDAPRLDVRLAGLEQHSPIRVLLTRRPREGGAPSPAPDAGPVREMNPRLREDDGVVVIGAPEEIAGLPADHLLIEGGAQTAAAFLRAKLVDRLLLYRAPVLIGGGRAALGDIGLTDLAAAHGRWQRRDTRRLGSDTLEVYVAAPCSPE
ncbi:riboflavin biosynthesis protein RibD [Sphingomonas sp. Leaf33]|uniref:bifunctional diaminohydroxyphosphoribosylaminopyrimidine deaminase/5-amino-6-(5-phosphoribosylamino)uracil reductase RibD n=1 Tax=Sphingomonas sp. Leaf33 TaxID=1736215 RepID=UPI0006F1FF63|nr:bifunctional diaminohydroxyphosphoribosylaminopyrimidine deaminase/5-amino-6-(5-phosphoribosylamino)uracil reductase RibD [Sphingomonas sp. Leaf33]KQN24737.1 riboflavin biosynthesis protein RibD [Sphingomonas sp. Leaf33]